MYDYPSNLHRFLVAHVPFPQGKKDVPLRAGTSMNAEEFTMKLRAPENVNIAKTTLAALLWAADTQTKLPSSSDTMSAQQKKEIKMLAVGPYADKAWEYIKAWVGKFKLPMHKAFKVSAEAAPSGVLATSAALADELDAIVASGGDGGEA